MDDIETRLRVLERRWNELSKLRNVFAITPNNKDAILYNAALAQWEAGPTSGVLPPGTIFNLNRIFHFPTTDVAPTQYTKSTANLQAALGAATSSQLVEIYGPCTLTGNFTVPAGVELRASPPYTVILAGMVQLGNGSYLNNVKIYNTANSADALYGVTGPATGSAYVVGCDIYAIQSGAGNAYAVGAINGQASNNGHLYVDDCKLYGSSVGGSGYAGRSTHGYLYITGNTRGVYGSTDRFTTT